MSAQTIAQQLYVAYFGRPADFSGARNFANEVQKLLPNAQSIVDLVQAIKTPGVAALVNSFGSSQESIDLYGSGSTSNFVNAVYRNVLDRDADVPGLTFWVDKLQANEISRAEFSAVLMAGAIQNTQSPTDQNTVAKKIAVAQQFTSALDTTAEINAYSGNDAAAAARALLNDVDSTTDVIAFGARVNSTIDALVNPPPPPAPTFDLVSNVANVNEGAAVVFTLNTTLIPNGTTYNYVISGVDSADITGGALTGTIVINNGVGTVQVNLAADRLTEGAENLTLTVQGTGQATAPARTVVVNDTSANAAPVVQPATNAVNEDASVFGTVATAATDADGDALTFARAATQPVVPGLTFNADGSYSFDASAFDSLGVGQTATVTFNFTATDGRATTPGTLTITVNGTNDAPVFGGAVTVMGNEDAAQITGSVVATDVDNGDVLTYALGSTSPANGAVTVNPNGSFAYVPAANFNGTDTFSVTVSDGKGGVATQVVTVNVAAVNDAADVITAPGVVTGAVTEDSLANTVSGQATHTDIDNAVSYQAVTAGTTANGYGSFAVSAAGLWTYTLNNSNPTVNNLSAGQTLTDTFTLLTADGTPQTVTITINGANESLQYTAGADDLQGTTGVDVFEGGTVQAGGNHTIGTADTADGKEGADTLRVTMQENNIVPRIVNIETVEIQALDAGTGAISIVDMVNARGVTSLVNAASTDTLTVNNAQEPMSVVVNGATAVTNVGFAATAANTAATQQTVSLSNVNEFAPIAGEVALTYTGAAPATLNVDRSNSAAADVSVTGGAINTLNLTSTNAAGIVYGNDDGKADVTGTATQGSITTLGLAGSSNVVVDRQTGANDLTQAVNTINAQTLTGTLNIDLLGNNLATTFNGSNTNTRLEIGQGNNTLNMGSADDLIILSSSGLNSLDSINGGAGSNSLEVHYNNAVTSTTGLQGTYDALANSTGIQTLVVDVWSQTGLGAVNNPNEDVVLNQAQLAASVTNVDIQDTSEDDADAAVANSGNGNRDDEVGAITLNNASTAVTYRVLANNTGNIVANGSGLNLVIQGVDVDGQTNDIVAGVNLLGLTGAANITLNNSSGTVVDESTNNVGFVGGNTYNTTAGNTNLGTVALANTGRVNLAGTVANATLAVTGADIVVDASALNTQAGSLAVPAANVIDASGANRATITGTAQADTITGTGGIDTIAAGEGNNTVAAGEGNNTVTAGNGNNTITALTGNDSVTVGNGSNSIDVGSGDNTVVVGNGANNTVIAAGGNDNITVGDGSNAVINAGEGNNTVTVGNGLNSTIITGAGNDTIVAGNGGKTVNAGAGDNTVTTGSGADTITVGLGLQNVTSGAGDDTIAFTTGLTSADQVNGGEGTDTLRVDEATVSLLDGVFNLINDVEVLNLAGGNANVTFNAIANARAFNRVTLVNGNNTLTVAEGFNKPTLTVDLGTGNDNVTVNAASASSLVVNSTSSRLTAADMITASQGAGDVLNVTADGGPADLANVIRVETLNILDNTPIADVATTVTLGADASLSLVEAAASNDSLTVNAAAQVGLGSGATINTGSGSDVITLSDRGHTVNAGAGNNTVTGGAGVDSITAANGNNTINAGGGNDTVVVGNGTNSINGGMGNDSITVGNGTNTILGDAGNDTIVVGTGSNQITGGAGADIITLGSGNNTVFYNAAAESGGVSIDEIINFKSLAAPSINFDQLDFNLAAGPVTFLGNFDNITQANTAFTPAFAGGVEAVYVRGENTLYVNVNASDNVIGAGDMAIKFTGLVGELAQADFI